jgi:hypothetical protein
MLSSFSMLSLSAFGHFDGDSPSAWQIDAPAIASRTQLTIDFHKKNMGTPWYT